MILILPNVPEDTDFGIRVTGDSMLPRYVPGQIVFVEQCKELFDGEIGVFIYDGNAYIKQYTESVPSNDVLENTRPVRELSGRKST